MTLPMTSPRNVWRTKLLLAMVVWTDFFAVVSGQIGVDLCACTPSSYTFEVRLDLTCPGNIDSNPGIDQTTCLSQTERGNPNNEDFVPVSVSTVQITEANAGFQVVKIVEFQGTGDFTQGDLIEYTSVTAERSDLTQDEIITFLQLNVQGRNVAGDDISNNFIIQVTNDCGVFPVLSIGDRVGWLRIDDATFPRNLYCPGNPTPLPSSSPSLSGLPSVSPTTMPTSSPSFHPTSTPSTTPSSLPSSLPSFVPTTLPTVTPTSMPSSVPSLVPTAVPSMLPSVFPTVRPTTSVFPTPTEPTTGQPTDEPTPLATSLPTPLSPTKIPIEPVPTTEAPTTFSKPTQKPTEKPVYLCPPVTPTKRGKESKSDSIGKKSKNSDNGKGTKSAYGGKKSDTGGKGSTSSGKKETSVPDMPKKKVKSKKNRRGHKLEVWVSNESRDLNGAYEAYSRLSGQRSLGYEKSSPTKTDEKSSKRQGKSPVSPPSLCLQTPPPKKLARRPKATKSHRMEKIPKYGKGKGKKSSSYGEGKRKGATQNDHGKKGMYTATPTVSKGEKAKSQPPTEQKDMSKPSHLPTSRPSSKPTEKPKQQADDLYTDPPVSPSKSMKPKSMKS